MMNNRVSRRVFLGVGAVALAALIYALLDRLWYAAVPRTRPRWFDDSRDWQQADKIGHGFTAYWLSRAAYYALLWAQVPAEKARYYAALLGFAAVSPIEILDSFAATHGASAYDLAANAAGAWLFALQEQAAGRQILLPKFWFSPSPYARLRPEKLGKTLVEQIIKDYNGQTYWLSFPVSLSDTGFSRIRLAAGYGATGMLYGNPEQNRRAGQRPQRHFFLGLDFILPERFRNSQTGKLAGFLSEIFRLPLPKIELMRL